MKQKMPEQFRYSVYDGRTPAILVTSESHGRNGLFFIRYGKETLRTIISDGHGWDHVSVSLSYRCPTWAEMCFIKDLFWEPEECVIQYHPPKSDYVNCHPFCLHLWKPAGVELPRPPKEMVGP